MILQNKFPTFVHIAVHNKRKSNELMCLAKQVNTFINNHLRLSHVINVRVLKSTFMNFSSQIINNS